MLVKIHYITTPEFVMKITFVNYTLILMYQAGDKNNHGTFSRSGEISNMHFLHLQYVFLNLNFV